MFTFTCITIVEVHFTLPRAIYACAQRGKITSWIQADKEQKLKHIKW